MTKPVFWNAKSCLILAIIIALIHGLKNSLGGFDVSLEWYRVFGLSLSGFLGGDVWAVFTYAFLHEGWFHLSINLLFIVFIGAHVECRFGWKLWWRIVIAGVMCGGVFHLLVSVWYVSQGVAEAYLIGMSGACYALLLALATSLGDRRFLFIPVSAKNLALGAVISQLLLLLMSPSSGLPVFFQLGERFIAMGFGDLFRSSFSCHLGGAFAGWWIARKHLRGIKT